MARNRWWSMMLVVCHLLGLFTALVAAHTQIPARAQVGWASWYGPGFHGRETASGERFSMHELTAAHRTLPLGTKVLVQNLETEAQIEVKINDRGPYVDPQHRIIDLSQAAADGIGLRGRGVGPVRVIVSEEGPALQTPGETALYEVQVGAFLKRAQAAEVLEQLWQRYPAAYVITREGPVGRYYRVRLGPFETQAQAQQLARILRQEGYAVFVDALAARSPPAPYLSLAAEKRRRATEGVGDGTVNTASTSPIPLSRTHISIMAFMVLGGASSLLIWTRHLLVSAPRRNPLCANARPLPGPAPLWLHASEGRRP